MWDPPKSTATHVDTTELTQMNTNRYKLNETFYSRRSYTHHFDHMVGWEFTVYQELPNGSLILGCPIRTDKLIQVERDEVVTINN
jgi:hypothetical protein